MFSMMRRSSAFTSTLAGASIGGIAAGYLYASYLESFDPSTWEASGPPLVVRAYEGASAAGALLRALSASVQAQRALATPQDEEALLFKAVVASILADLSVNGTSERRRTIAAAGNGSVVDWLLRCLRRGGSAEQQEAERALATMFNDPHVAPQLWERPAVLPRVLQFMAQSGDTGPLGDALIASVMAPGGGVTALEELPARSDVELLVALAGGRHGARVRHVASWALAQWSLLSEPVRRMVAEAGGAQGLLRALEDSLGSYEHPFVRAYVARGLSALVQFTPPDMIMSWIGPLVTVWEDALEARDLTTAALCMDALNQALHAAEETQKRGVATSILSAAAQRRTPRTARRHRAQPPPSSPPPPPVVAQPSLPSDDRAAQLRSIGVQGAAEGPASTSGRTQPAAMKSLDQFLETNPSVKLLLEHLGSLLPRARADTAASALSSPSTAQLSPLSTPSTSLTDLLRRTAAAFSSPGASKDPATATQDLRALQRSLCALLTSLAAAAPHPLIALDLAPLLRAVADVFRPPPDAAPDATTAAAAACLRELANLPGPYGRAAELLWAAELLRLAARARAENPEGQDGYLGSSFLRNIWWTQRKGSAPGPGPGPAQESNHKRVTPGQEGVKANPAALATALVAETAATTETLLKSLAADALARAGGDDTRLPVPPSALDFSLWRCLELLGDLSLDHGTLLQDLGQCGLMPLLRRIGPDNTRTIGPGSAVMPGSEENVPHLLRRTCLRFLAILALQEPFAPAIRSDVKLLRFIRNSVQSEDLRYTSHARRALLHLEADPAAGRPAIWYPDGVHLLAPDAANLADAAQVPPGPGWAFDLVFIHGLRGGAFVTWRVGSPKPAPTGDLAARQAQQHQAMGSAAHTAAAGAPKEGWAAVGGAMALMAPDHGDPASAEAFPTPSQNGPSSHAYYTLRRDCWPSLWLANDFPGARILSVEYAAPAVDAEGHVLPFDELGSRMLDKLVAAGVGQRPVVLVAHSLGGLLAKEMLLQGAQAAQGSGRAEFTDSTRGLVFYSVPHFGSWLADLGWRLKGGWAPSPHVAQLRYGPHLEELNDFVRKLHKKKKVEVLSFLETGKTAFLTGPKGYAINVEVVPLESAYPGYGDLQVMDRDHINSCKPASREEESYGKLADFLQFVTARWETAAAPRGATTGAAGERTPSPSGSGGV